MTDGHFMNHDGCPVCEELEAEFWRQQHLYNEYRAQMLRSERGRTPRLWLVWPRSRPDSAEDGPNEP